MGGGPEFSYPSKPAPKAPEPGTPDVNKMKPASITKELRAIKEKRAQLHQEREAIVQTYQDQLTALEQRRKELAEKCPHTRMLYGIYNQCADCEEWF